MAPALSSALRSLKVAARGRFLARAAARCFLPALDGLRNGFLPALDGLRTGCGEVEQAVQALLRSVYVVQQGLLLNRPQPIIHVDAVAFDVGRDLVLL